MLDVHLVLDELYDGKDEVGIAKPAEDIVEHRQVLVLHTARNTMREWCEDYAMDVRKTALDGTGNGECVVVGIARHTEHKVHIGCRKHLLGFLDSGDLREGWRIAEAKLHILVIYLLLHPTVVLQHEGVVGVGNYKHVVHAAHHQIDERHVFQVELIPLLWYIAFHFYIDV